MHKRRLRIIKNEKRITASILCALHGNGEVDLFIQRGRYHLVLFAGTLENVESGLENLRQQVVELHRGSSALKVSPGDERLAVEEFQRIIDWGLE